MSVFSIQNSSSLDQIESELLRKQLQLSEQLQLIEQSDPVLLDYAEVSESGTESWEADVHIRTLVIKNQIKNQLNKITQALVKIKYGTYGICDKCGKVINSERLRLIPSAHTCVHCL